MPVKARMHLKIWLTRADGDAVDKEGQELVGQGRIELLRRMADDGCDTCVMEVSSLGLKAGRVAGLAFAVGIFTNFSPDHIGPGEHADLAEYLHWKAALFPHCAAGVFNNDDAWVGKIRQGAPCRAVTYGIDSPADLRADAVDRNAPRRDHLLCLAARSDAALRKHLLQSCIFSHSSKPFSVSLNL